MKQTYSGACHCGAVRYEVDLDLSCLENIPAAELAALPIVYVDGLHDDFKSPPAETRHL